MIDRWLELQLGPRFDSTAEDPMPASTVEEGIGVARDIALEVARTRQVPVRWRILDHTEDVDPTCAQGWCKAPIVASGTADPLPLTYRDER